MRFDPLLEVVVAASNAIGDASQGRAEVDITLLVSGMLVSGRIISARQFLLEHPLTDTVLEAVDKLKLEEEPAEEAEPDAPQFIHLADARFVVPGQAPIPSQGVNWRCRLSEVAGFHFGTLRSVSSE